VVTVPDGEESIKYTTTKAWWTPALLLLLLVPKQIRSGQLRWWIVDVAMLLLLLLVLYVVTHPTLTFSPMAISQKRGPFRVSIDLNDLQSVRINVTQRRTNVIDPQTGERRSIVRFYTKYPDDWGGKPPVQGFYIRDRDGHYLALGILRTESGRWCRYLLRAIKGQPDVELGPRVIEALENFTRGANP